MKHSHWILAATVVALPLLGCSNAASEKPKPVPHATVGAPELVKAALTAPNSDKPSTVEIRRITLSETSSKRLGIEFADIKGSAERLEAPYNALLYDANGGEWVFTSPAPNVFARTAIKVDAIEGEKVYYTKGPASGTKVVTMGAAELYGIEFGVGK